MNAYTEIFSQYFKYKHSFTKGIKMPCELLAFPKPKKLSLRECLDFFGVKHCQMDVKKGKIAPTYSWRCSYVFQRLIILYNVYYDIQDLKVKCF